MSRYHSVPISCVQKPSAACCPALLAASLVVGLGGDDRVGCGGGQGDGEGGGEGCGEGCGQGGGAVSRSHWQRVHYLLLHSLAKRPVSPLSRFHVQWISAHLVMVQWYSATVVQWYSSTVVQCNSLHYSVQCPPCWLLELWRDSIAGPSLRANHLH